MLHTFDNIVGHEQIKNSLKKSLETKRINHAFIFSGQEGMGKLLLAKTFAKTLQCEEQKSSPCNNCISCKTFESNNHPDIIYVNNTNTKSIGVDDVREQISKQTEIKPYKYTYKIFIVEEAEKLTVAAQNALLKTIEEPPAYGIFMLLTQNANSFLPTVISRCVRYNLRPLSFYQVSQYLTETRGLEPAKADLLAGFAQGNIGRALGLIEDEEFIAMRNNIINILKNINKTDLSEIFLYAKDTEIYKDRIQDALDIMYLWYRDLLLAKINSRDYIIQKDLEPLINNTVKELTIEKIIRNQDAVNTAKRQLKQYSNFILTMEILLMSLGRDSTIN